MGRPHFRIGLRTVKTALAVVTAMLAASLFGEPSIFPALSAFAVMARTFDEGLQECRNQAVGITIGGVLGCLAVFLWPEPPIWLMGLGVMLIIFICTSVRVVYSCGLSAAIFISACMTQPGDVVVNTLTRLFHTAIGLSIGLSINYLIMPYNNSKQIYGLLQALIDQLPAYLDRRLFHHLYPDLTAMDDLIARLHYELNIYRHQRFFHKHRHAGEFAFLQGCIQLAERIHRELTVLCALDAIGFPNPENFRQLSALGLSAPEVELPEYQADPEVSAVTNYHLRKLLEARGFLVRLLREQEQDT